MKYAKYALILMFLASLAHAAEYPPLVTNWDINLGGDTLDVRDIDHDGKQEIVLGLLRDQGSYAYLLDNQGILQWRNKISVIWPQNTPNTLIVDDIDENNNTDIVVGSVIEAKTCYGQLSPYENPIFMLERDPRVENNMLKWSHKGYGYSTSLYAINLDGKPGKELISGTRDGKVYAIYPDGTLMWAYETEGTINTVYATDLNNDGIPEIIAGSYKSIHLTDNLGNKIWKYPAGGQVTGVYAHDINNDRLKEVLATSGNDTIYALTAGGDLLWTYNLTALKGAITASDLDGDGYGETIVASGDITYAIDQNGKTKWDFEPGYPVVNLATGQLNTTQPNLLILGARRLTTHQINPDFLNNNKAQENLTQARKEYANDSFEQAKDHATQAAEIFAQLKDNPNLEEAVKINESATLQIRAAQLLAFAQSNYTAGDYNTAKNLSVQAEKIYLELKDTNRTAQAQKIVNRAIDQNDADYFYQRALEYFRNANYLEGSIYSKKALDNYKSLNDTTNTQKALKLLNNTEEYPKANKNYEESIRQYELGNYTQAKQRAQDATNSYATVGDDGRKETTTKLLANIQEKIRLEETLEKAKENYARAETKANQTNYNGCAEEAAKALEQYNNITNDEGTRKTQNLIRKCETGIEAQQDYAKANELYTQNRIEEAKDYLAKSRQLYRTIDDYDGALKNTNLILEIDEEQQLKQRTQSANQGNQNTIIIAAGAAAIMFIIVTTVLILRKLKKKQKDKQPKEDYTTLLQPEPHKPVTEALDALIAEQNKTAPQTQPEQPTIVPETPKETPTFKEEEESISSKLDELLSKVPTTPTPQPKPPEDKTPAPDQPPQKTTPQKEPKPPERTLDQLLNKKPKTPEKPAPPPPEKPPETTPGEEIKIAENIKKQLAEINKKLTGK